MDVPPRNKAKNKKAKTDKPKSPKKRKCDGATCSTFLAELTKKFTTKKKQKEASNNIVQSIIDSITNALPIKFSKRTPEVKESPVKIESLQTYAPELLPNDTIEIARPILSGPETPVLNFEIPTKRSFLIPRMPLANSEIYKTLNEKKTKIVKEDAAVNTSDERDVAKEIAKHVATLRKISLIAEEFNQKTAKNLKEIVDSVQQDLIKKLEQVKAEQRTNSSKSEKQLRINAN